MSLKQFRSEENNTETITAGNMKYQTDVVQVNEDRVNHVEFDCDSCSWVNNLAIDINKEIAVCPICDNEERLTVNMLTKNGTYIESSTRDNQR